MNDKQSPALQSIDRSIADAREALNMASEAAAALPNGRDRDDVLVIVKTRDAALSALIEARGNVESAERFAARSW